MRNKYIGVTAGIVIAMVIVAGGAFYVMSGIAKPDTKWYTQDRKAAEFTISTAKELEGLAQIVNGTWGKKPERDNFAGKTISLVEDIDLSGYDNWIPIGDYSSDALNVFAGTFNGGGHVISNLTINRPGVDIQGLFGQVDNGGSVRELGLDNVNITGRGRVGGVAGVVNTGSSVSDCYSSGGVNGTAVVGGIVGAIKDSSVVANSYSSAAVSGDTIVGGVAGQALSGSGLANSYSTGAVSGNFVTGGLVGSVRDNGRIVGCYSTGMVSGGVIVGGVVGSIDGGSSVVNSYSSGAIGGRSTVGGLVGSVRAHSVVNGGYSTGEISGGIAVGGIAGLVDINSRVANSYSTGTVTSDRDVGAGGVAGQIRRNSIVVNSYSVGAVSGNKQVGGVVGSVSDSGRVVNSYASGAVSGNRQVGGVAGLVSSGGNVTNSYSVGAVIGTGNAVGGIVGSVERRSGVTNCAALNPQVKGVGATIGRVAGELSVGTLSNNIAFAEMKNSADATDWRDKGATAKNGVDITKAALAKGDSIGGRFTSADGWTLRNGKLPGLGGRAASMPTHLREAGYIDPDPDPESGHVGAVAEPIGGSANDQVDYTRGESE